MPEAQPKVLLIDDDASVRMLVRAGLTRRGFAVADAADGPSGLAKFAELHPDILLVDAMMPGMDGFEACRAIRALPEGEHVPIVMLTGLDDDASIAKAYDSGATDFYVKSAQMTLLAERLRYLLRTARMRADLARSRAKLAAAQRIARLGSWEWDLAARAIDATPECRQMLGLPAGDGALPEADFIRLFYRDGHDAFRFEVLAHLKANRALSLSGAVRLPQGMHTLEVEVDGERDRQGNLVRVNGTMQDVTERRNAEAQLRRLADFDPLTGLANRNLFRARLDEAIGDARSKLARAGVLVVGLDRFKAVNETLGQAGGDALLREAAQRLNASIRARETAGDEAVDEANGAVARLGSDEFTILLRDLGEREHAARVAERVLRAIEKPYVIEGAECWVTASVGGATFPEDADSGEAVLTRAGAAMRQAKAGGRNAFRFWERSRGAEGSDKLRLEANLRKALDKGELLLHWQPIINVAENRVQGAEVLMRWQHEGRLISPSEFIPLAEETGLIVPMGEWALETACGQLAHWRSQGKGDFYVGVNLTASHVQQRDVERQVGDLLDKHGLPPGALALELTESLLMDFVQPTLRGLHALKKLGVKIAIDDFGTGYSSLSYLKRLPVTTLKIDRSFIIDIADDPDDAAIVSAIAGLAGTLSLNVVVEGVETEAQRAALVEQGVTTMQGYFFSRPLPIEAFDALLRQGAELPT